MTLPRCVNCRYWQPAGDKDERARFEDDLALRDPETYERLDVVRFCHAPNLRFAERPADNGAAVVDGSTYYAGLVTGPQFGCVNHSAVDAP